MRTTLRPPAPDLSVRTCARCHKHYVWPKTSRRPSGECPRCQPVASQLSILSN